MLPDSKEIELASNNWEASPQVGKTAREVLLSCRAWNWVATAISYGVDIPEVPGVICYHKWVLSEGEKNSFKDRFLMNSQSNFLICSSFLTQLNAVLSKVFKPDNFESLNSLKSSSTNIQGLHSNFMILKFSNSPIILVLYETILDDSIGSSNCSVKGYLPLIWKGSVTNMHSHAVYVKEGLHFAWNLFSETPRILTRAFKWHYFIWCLILFPLLITIFVSMQGFWCYLYLT